MPAGWPGLVPKTFFFLVSSIPDKSWMNLVFQQIWCFDLDSNSFIKGSPFITYSWVLPYSTLIRDIYWLGKNLSLYSRLNIPVLTLFDWFW